MKRVLKRLSNYKVECVAAPIMKLTEASFELCVPLIVKNIIDVAILNKNYQDIRNQFITLGILALLGFCFSITAQYFSAKAATGFGAQLRHDIFKKIQGFSFSTLDKLGTSTLINRLTVDINQVQTGTNLFLRLFLRSPFVVFGAMLMAFTIDKKMSLIFLVTIVILSAVVFTIMLLGIPMYKKVRIALDDITLKTRESLSGIRVIRAFSAEKKETADFNEKIDRITELQKYSAKFSALLNPITMVIVNLAIIYLINRGSVSINSGILTQGALVALYNYMSQILIELVKLANLIITLTKSVACANRVGAILEIEDDTKKDGASQFNGENEEAIRFENVSLKYQNAAEDSISDISFSVKKGETVGIIGSTGSGKSSLVGLIPRFYDATGGCIYIFGEKIENQDIDYLRRKIGIVMQKTMLFSGTIKENILWGKSDASDEDVKMAVDASQSRDVVSSKTLGLEEMIEENGQNLSGGQKQRLSIARALVRKPEILILDDSSSALDYKTDKNLREAIKGLPFNPTVFVVSQRCNSIMDADKIIVLDDGKSVGVGTHAELLENCPVYREIYNSQYSKGGEAV